MGFGIDYDNVVTGGVMPEGDYEMIIKAAYEDTTKNSSKVYINMPLIVRNDVEQAYKNAHLWHSLWKRKEPTAADISCGNYSAAQINTISKAAGLPNGKKYESLGAWLGELKGKLLLVSVKHEEYPAGSGKMQAKVNFINPTKKPDCKHVFKDTDIPSVNDAFMPAPELNDEDIPF